MERVRYVGEVCGLRKELIVSIRNMLIRNHLTEITLIQNSIEEPICALWSEPGSDYYSYCPIRTVRLRETCALTFLVENSETYKRGSFICEDWEMNSFGLGSLLELREWVLEALSHRFSRIVCRECGKPLEEGYKISIGQGVFIGYCSKECLGIHLTEHSIERLVYEEKKDTIDDMWSKFRKFRTK